jgi:Zn-dependent protease
VNYILFRNILFHSSFFFTLAQGWFTFLHTGIFINLALALFNLIPIPPLDGHHILSGLLPEHLAQKYSNINQTYSMLIILILFISGFISKIIITFIVY